MLRKSTEQIKKIKRWLGKRGWNYSGSYYESPVYDNGGFCFTDPSTGEITKQWSEESYASFCIEPSVVGIKLCKRKHIYKRDESVPNDNFWHSFVPSDEFTEWEEKGYAAIPAEDILKLAELIIAHQKEYCEIRDIHSNPSDFKITKKNKQHQFIGRTTTYEEIKRIFGNETLREKRGCIDPFEWSRKQKEGK